MDYTELKDKVPPQNLEAEQATLGALLLNWDALSSIRSLLSPDHFYSYQNRLIYQAITDLDNDHVHGDTLTLINQLAKENKLEEAGGAAAIAALTDTVPTSSNVEYYAKIVLDQAVRRELIKISSEVKALSFDKSKSSRAILDDAEQRIFSLADKNQTTEIYSMKKIIPKIVEIIDERYKSHNAFTGVPTGFSELDTMTSGFQASELIIIGARPSIGKTAMALSMMQYIAVQKKIPCGFFSLEMSFEMIGQRLLSQEARIPGSKLRSGFLKMEEFKKLQDAAARCFQSPLFIVDTPNMQLLDLRAMARRMVSTHEVKIIFIDYIGLIATENNSAPVYEQISEVSKTLKALARELRIPIIALCQVARDAEGAEPTLAQLRGSGSIEQDADMVIFLHRDRIKTAEQGANPVQDAKLIVAKQRNGPTGNVEMSFISAYTKFENKASEK